MKIKFKDYEYVLQGTYEDGDFEYYHVVEVPQEKVIQILKLLGEDPEMSETDYEVETVGQVFEDE